jgi:hypothetical protein
MIERGGRTRLLLKAPQAIGVARECRRQDFDRDVAIQSRIARAIDLAMPPAPRSAAIS